MASGTDYYIVKSETPNELLFCSCQWNEDNSAFASGDNDYANYYLNGVILENDLEETLNSPNGLKWKNCKVQESEFIIDELKTNKFIQ